MIIPKRFRLERVCGSDERPLLDHIGTMLYQYTDDERIAMRECYGRTIADQANAVAIAANGFAMVVAPCVLEGSDALDGVTLSAATPALHKSAFVEAHKYWSRVGLDYVRFGLERDVVRIDEWTTVKRLKGLSASEYAGKYPSYGSVLKTAMQRQTSTSEYFGKDGAGKTRRQRMVFSMALMNGACDALGIKEGQYHVVLSTESAFQPILVLPTYGAVRTMDVPVSPPYAIVMPIATVFDPNILSREDEAWTLYEKRESDVPKGGAPVPS